MNSEDLTLIETRLALKLPAAYRDALLAGVELNSSAPEPYFQQDATELLITNLELRMSPNQDAFDGGAWPADGICIGDDGSGNIYFIRANDEKCAVECYDHETGEFEAVSDSLEGYFAYIENLLRTMAAITGGRGPSIDSPPVAEHKSGAAIVRTATLRESVLNPISMEEWTAFVESDAELEMRGYRSIVNPFNREEIRTESPGLAVMQEDDSNQEFEYTCGRIMVRRPSHAALAKLDEAASVLNAKVLTGW
ncbi:MAG: SMI1/KNR4 family protein [Planctomycetaceae bacterium]|nr:SMI1/KNR4 family protein [Planctomycetaceae bacterium]